MAQNGFFRGVTFCFGQLHGFGLADALKEIGLLHGNVPQALFTSNLGAKASQLVSVAAMIVPFRAARAMTRLPPFANEGAGVCAGVSRHASPLPGISVAGVFFPPRRESWLPISLLPLRTDCSMFLVSEAP